LKGNLIYKIVTLFVLWLAAQVADAGQSNGDRQGLNFKDILLQLRTNVSRVSELSGSSEHKELGDFVSSLQKSIDILDSRREAHPTINYLLMLDDDRSAIEAFLGDPQAENLKANFKVAVDDLATKSYQAVNLSAAFAAVGDTVEVTVTTEHDGQVVSGYLVRANPFTVKNEQPPRFIFNNPTSPSEGELPPGFVWLWVEKPSGTVVTGDVYRIGGNGSPVQPPIRILVP
jgi:hypothetical protein